MQSGIAVRFIRYESAHLHLPPPSLTKSSPPRSNTPLYPCLPLPVGRQGQAGPLDIGERRVKGSGLHHDKVCFNGNMENRCHELAHHCGLISINHPAKDSCYFFALICNKYRNSATAEYAIANSVAAAMPNLLPMPAGVNE